MTRVLPVGTPEHAVLDVVFIHGLDGDARKTWSRKEKESFWPKWLTEEFVDVAVWTVDYDAWSSGWRGRSMPMQDRAVNLMTQLQNHGIGERPLCFVTHSMGGLLAKEILLHAADARTEFAVFAAETKGVVFLATPHTGAGLTKAVEALGVLYRGTPAISDLERNQPYLRHLNDRYRNWVDEVKVQNLVFFETHCTSGMRVVDETSANPGLAGVTSIPVDADHIDICKPADRASLVYGRVKRFITAVRSSLGRAEPLTPATPGVGESPERHDRGWTELVGRQSLWNRIETEENDDALRRQCVAAADHLALRRQEAEEALAGDPWLEDNLAERIADEVERLFGCMGDSAPELTAAEVAVLLLAPLVYHVYWVRRASLLSRITPTKLTPTGSSDPDRAAYEEFIRLPRQRRLVDRAARTARSEAIAWWLFHRWEAGAPRVAAGALLDGLLAEAPIDPGLASILGRVVMAMRLAPEELSYVETLNPNKWASGVQVREQLLGLILLLARGWATELLTLSPTVVEHLGIPTPLNLDHLRAGVRGRHWNQGARRDIVTLQADCRHEAEYEALREHAAWVDALLAAVRLFAEDRRALGPLLALPIRASADSVEPALENGKPAFVTPITRFRMDESRIQELLMGEQLYGDPALAIRELYQNALDACRYRKAYYDYQAKIHDGLAAGWQGEITFTQGRDPSDRAYLQCTDDGIGMNAEELRSVFATAGARLVERAEFHRQLAEWRAQKVRFFPNSRFGIGVFSYFMIADEIVVTTRRMETASHQPTRAFEVTIVGPGHLFRIREAADQSVKIGTTVRLYLRDPGPRTAQPSCVDLLRKVLGVAEHRTVAVHEGRRATWSTRLAPREGPAWEQDGINAHGELVHCEAVLGGGQVTWCEYGGALLVDGLYLRPAVRRGVLADPADAREPFGVVINLVDDWRPTPSVNRALALDDVSHRVRSLLTMSVDTLFEERPSFFRAGWLSHLAELSPGIADLVTSEAVRACVDLPLGNRVIDMSRTGWFPPDVKLLGVEDEENQAWSPQPHADSVPRGGSPRVDVDDLPDHLTLWRLLAHGDALIDQLAAVCPDIRSPGPIMPARPSDAAFFVNLESWSRSGKPEVDIPPPHGHLLSIAAGTGMTPRETAQRAIDLGAKGVTIEHFSDDATLDLNTTDLALLSRRLDGRQPWLTVDEPVELEHIVLAHQRMRISCVAAARRLSELGYHVRNADHLRERPAEDDPVLLSGLDGRETVPPGHIVAVSRRLGISVREVVERLAGYGLHARPIPGPVLEHDVKILCRNADGNRPWIEPTARVRRHHIVKASAVLGLACGELAARLREYRFDVSPIEELPARAGDRELALLRRELDGEGSWIDTEEPVPAGHLVALSRRYGWTVREVADRLASYELTVPAELPDRPEDADLMLLSEYFDEEPPWLTTEVPVAPGRILVAAQRRGRTVEEIADRLRAYGFNPLPTSTLPDRPTLIDIKLLSRDFDGKRPWLTSAEPVTLTFLVRAAREFRLDILDVVTRLTNAQLDVPDPAELVRTAFARMPRVANRADAATR